MFLMYWNTKKFNCGPVVHYCIYSGQSSNYYLAPLPGPCRDQGQLVYVVWQLNSSWARLYYIRCREFDPGKPLDCKVDEREFPDE